MNRSTSTMNYYFTMNKEANSIISKINYNYSCRE